LNIKDNFSAIAAGYAAWRPQYPETLFAFLSSLSSSHDRALDCGTGNGQAAKLLAAHFKEVFATDISAAQLQHAVVLPNIFYSVSTAEQTAFPNHYFDIVCAAQAVHWFDHPVFYKEVERIIKPGGVLALIGYGLITIEKQLDDLIMFLYKDILGSYWDKERKFIDDHYQSLPFPYEPITTPEFKIQDEWNFLQLAGYLNTWSALGHYKKMNNEDPLQNLLPALQKVWGAEDSVRTVCFPVITRIAIIK
jgi:ubiquinone/menaquinone biosynthesis C-methylase UbiE